MFPLCNGLLCLAAIAAMLPGALAQGQDELFASWGKAQKDVHSLVVEFTLDTWHPAFRERERWLGTFKLLRTPEGEVLASYEVRAEKPKADKPQRCSGLLSGGKVYLLDHDRKLALRFSSAEQDLLCFLVRHVNPFVILLDRKLAEEKCQVEVASKDQWYTYLTVRPKPVKGSGWFPPSLQGRAVFMNRATDGVPQDMPKLLWYTDGIQEYTFDIGTWRLNAAEALKREEFRRPEDRPGWEVGEWPFQTKKK